MGKTTIICLITAMSLYVVMAILPLNQQNVSAQSISQPYDTTNTCENNTSMPANYFTLTCNNTLIKTNDTITNLSCDTTEGWIILCAWQQQSNQSNQSNQTNGTSQSTISVGTSIDGGNSFNASKVNFANSSSSARN